MPRARIQIEAPGRPALDLEVLVAAAPEQRAAGFQHVCPGGFDGRAILFVYAEDTRGRFHMRNVHAALDIAFADADGRVFEIQHMRPGAEDAQAAELRYQARQPFRFALEVPAGWFAARWLQADSARMQWAGLPGAPVPGAAP